MRSSPTLGERQPVVGIGFYARIDTEHVFQERDRRAAGTGYVTYLSSATIQKPIVVMMSDMTETHPASGRARLARRLRGLRRFPGWHRAVNWIVPADTEGSFLVQNGPLVFAGDIESYIEREMYLFGDYEGPEIEQFLSVTSKGPRRVLLDIGANVGTHSLRFARHFDQVHSFEPNPSLWAVFERNVSLNGFHNVMLHNVGLGAEDAELPFYSIDCSNHGLGTFLPAEQYDRPLQLVGHSRIAHGDRYLQARDITHVDAIKVDVQGFEASVLGGLRETLEASRPAVWFELGAGTRNSALLADPRGWFPYEVDLFRLVRISGPLLATRLARVISDPPLGDYLALPAVSKPASGPMGRVVSAASPTEPR